MENNKYLFGASGHAKVVLDVLFSNNIKVLAVVDDNPKAPYISTIPVVNTKDFKSPEGSQFIVAVGDNAIRKKIVNKNNFRYFSAVHSDATISAFASLEEGTIVMPQVVVNSDAKIGKHCILNSRSVVEHDCFLEDYVHISPNASLAGNVFVGEGTQIGIGASVIQGIKIGKWVTVGAGAVIISDIPDYAIVVGNPGKIIKISTP
ncbi:acetyltransferase [uncultured Flavobacterium sp.]|uniref:acetyltransferase n=1 Tax=uncultured Flavobacterium sp. TaxID=165435 RepID=UPI0030EC2F6A|tara:strand:- start:59722 stop:60336 length:615 start_codon:yes stop_codon:yes gene_type:complete